MIIDNTIICLEIFAETGGNVRIISIKNTDMGNMVKIWNIPEYSSRKIDINKMTIII